MFLYGRGSEIRTHDTDFKDQCLRPLGDAPTKLQQIFKEQDVYCIPNTMVWQHFIRFVVYLQQMSQIH